MRPAFVISPIGRQGSPQRSDADDVLETFIRPPANKHGFEPYRGDDVSAPGMIVSQICDSIMRDELIFAYLKDGNPNVYYELAIAHTLRKPVILLKAPNECIPFDVGGTRVISLDRTSVAGSCQRIEEQIRALCDSSAAVASPVQITPEQVLASVMPRVVRHEPALIDVSGVWTGFTIETFPPGSDAAYQKYHAEMRLNAIGIYVTGSVFIAYGDDFDQPAKNTAVLHLHGAYRPPRFVRLNYDNDRVAHHCGVLFIEIQSNGREMIGTFAGYGVASEQPVHGKLTMRKAEQAHALEPATGPDSNAESSPPAQ